MYIDKIIYIMYAGGDFAWPSIANQGHQNNGADLYHKYQKG